MAIVLAMNYSKLVAQRLQQALRSNDKVCRVGGDEFILLIDLLVPGQEGLATAQAVAERIRASIVKTVLR